MKFIENPMDELTIESLAEENIRPKFRFPYVWRIGNKDVTFGEIEDLYRMAKLRKEEFENRMSKMETMN